MEANTDQDTFTTSDIEDAYKQLGENISNAAARASETVSEGWVQVAKTGQTREFVLTKTGAEVVEDLLE